MLKGLSDVQKAIDQTRINADKKIRAIYLKGLRGLILQTPVDTGRARGNWFLSVSSPVGVTAKSGRLSMIKAIKAMPKHILDKKIYLTNNLPYIVALEYGHSKQAPKGWVRAELKRMLADVRAIK